MSVAAHLKTPVVFAISFLYSPRFCYIQKNWENYCHQQLDLNSDGVMVIVLSFQIGRNHCIPLLILLCMPMERSAQGLLSLFNSASSSSKACFLPCYEGVMLSRIILQTKVCKIILLNMTFKSTLLTHDINDIVHNPAI